MRDDSKFLGFAAIELGESFSGEFVEAAFDGISLNFAIPSLPVVLDEPSTESCELFSGELFDLSLDRFDFGHAVSNDSAWPAIPQCLVFTAPA